MMREKRTQDDVGRLRRLIGEQVPGDIVDARPGRSRLQRRVGAPAVEVDAGQPHLYPVPRRPAVDGAKHVAIARPRSEERRLGEECVSTCSTRWSTYH